jgi:hypothetical protein
VFAAGLAERHNGALSRSGTINEYLDSAIAQRGGAGAKKPGKRGPKPGAIDRYGEADRALFPEMTGLMKEEHLTRLQAAKRLANDGKVAGIGTPYSRARRLAESYRDEVENSLQLAPTRCNYIPTTRRLLGL